MSEEGAEPPDEIVWVGRGDVMGDEIVWVGMGDGGLDCVELPLPSLEKASRPSPTSARCAIFIS